MTGRSPLSAAPEVTASSLWKNMSWVRVQSDGCFQDMNISISTEEYNSGNGNGGSELLLLDSTDSQQGSSQPFSSHSQSTDSQVSSSHDPSIDRLTVGVFCQAQVNGEYFVKITGPKQHADTECSYAVLAKRRKGSLSGSSLRKSLLAGVEEMRTALGIKREGDYAKGQIVLKNGQDRSVFTILRENKQWRVLNEGKALWLCRSQLGECFQIIREQVAASASECKQSTSDKAKAAKDSLSSENVNEETAEAGKENVTIMENGTQEKDKVNTCGPAILHGVLCSVMASPTEEMYFLKSRLLWVKRQYHLHSLSF